MHLYSPLIQPYVEFGGIESDESSDLEVGDPPLAHQALYVPVGYSQGLGHLRHVEQRR